eukprot:TRINITY_DN2907_c0_g1_i2.p3 TRINITY_DN2907_c0_g1~~TRINITY_DN2907_c0_g1_i2.p3  ORF type:complete len:102 (-),score=16.09 TRINITY_DN2907_c0_g1_i2:745-1050(-)
MMAYADAPHKMVFAAHMMVLAADLMIYAAAAAHKLILAGHMMYAAPHIKASAADMDKNLAEALDKNLVGADYKKFAQDSKNPLPVYDLSPDADQAQYKNQN